MLAKKWAVLEYMYTEYSPLSCSLLHGNLTPFLLEIIVLPYIILAFLFCRTRRLPMVEIPGFYIKFIGAFQCNLSNLPSA
jgi:hypothetical protein